jgi:hypothetical protein
MNTVKRDWASEFQKISASSASFGSDFEHPLERDMNRAPFNQVVPDGATRRPDYDIFGADFGASRKKKKGHAPPGTSRAKHAKSVASQAGMHAGFGAAGGGGHASSGGGNPAPRSAPATSPTSSYSSTTAKVTPATPAVTSTTFATRPAPPTGQAFSPMPDHVLRPPSYAGGTYSYGYPNNRMSPERMMRIEARQVAQRYRDAGQVAEAEAIEAQYDGLYELEDDDFSGEPEKKGFPSWLLAVLGILGIYAGAEFLSHKVRETPKSHRLSY